MFKEAIRYLKTAFMLLLVLSIVTGILYPLSVTALAQYFFPDKAQGSIILKEGKAIGSLFIGQSFSTPNYFWGRPSATSPYPYKGDASSGSNSGPTNPEFLKTVKDRIEQLQQSDPLNHDLIPVDLVTASGSGLDPEISPLAAWYQAPRVARERHLSLEAVQTLIQEHTQARLLGFLGEPRVNVLQLNGALDNLRTEHGRPASGS
ncbi:MAG: potassium-transporting ATPase subunit KdpC [Legionellales bacterium]